MAEMKVLLDDVIDYELGLLDEEATVRLFAALVATGDAWLLQGSYGRTALVMIEAGLISRHGEVI